MYMVLDRDEDAVETLKTAWRVTDGHKMSLFWIFVVLFFINIAGILAFIIGVFFTAAYSTVVEAVVYEELMDPE